MYQAATRGDLALVEYHLRNGVDPNYQHPEILSTPLVASLLNGQPHIALFLLDHGADPRLRTEFDGLTPSEAAKKFGHTQVLEKLAQMGVQDEASSSLWGKLKRAIRLK